MITVTVLSFQLNFREVFCNQNYCYVVVVIYYRDFLYSHKIKDNMLRSNLLLPSSTQATFLYAHVLIVRAEANSLDAHYSYLHYPQTIKDDV